MLSSSTRAALAIQIRALQADPKSDFQRVRMSLSPTGSYPSPSIERVSDAATDRGRYTGTRLAGFGCSLRFAFGP